MNKVCSICGSEKDISDFTKDKSRKDGYRNECKKCRNSKQRASSKKWRNENKGHKNEYLKEYYSNNKDRFKEYRSEKAKEYYKINKAEIDKKHRIYRQSEKGKTINCRISHKRRILIANNKSYTLEQWKECLLFFGGCCAYSGKLLENSNTQIEHITPISKGGTNLISNIVPCLDKVNYSKGTKEMQKWYRKQEYFSEKRLNKIYSWIEYAKKYD